MRKGVEFRTQIGVKPWVVKARGWDKKWITARERLRVGERVFFMMRYIYLIPLFICYFV